MKENFPKELTLDMPIDEEMEFAKIKTIFLKHKATNRLQLIPYETIIKEDVINEDVFKKMIQKEYVRRTRGMFYYDIRMEEPRFRRHLHYMRFMIYSSILLYVIFTIIFFIELLWKKFEGNLEFFFGD